MSYLLKNEEYRPSVIEFAVSNNSEVVPDSLGSYNSAQEAVEFMAKHLTAINQKCTVSRFMDTYEKRLLREEYQEILEDKMPMVERDLMKATGAYEEAKKRLTEAKEYVNATTNEAKALAMQVKRGVKDITLDDLYTWRVPFNGRYWFYTFMDGVIKLCRVTDIPEYEKGDLWNAMNRNDGFFNDNFGGPIGEDPKHIRGLIKEANDYLESKAKDGEIMRIPYPSIQEVNDFIGRGSGEPVTDEVKYLKGEMGTVEYIDRNIAPVPPELAELLNGE